MVVAHKSFASDGRIKFHTCKAPGIEMDYRRFFYCAVKKVLAGFREKRRMHDTAIAEINLYV
jgi:hypothetical protein